MTDLIRKKLVAGMLVALMLGAASATEAQDSNWSGDVAIGWDNGLTGNVNASAIGSIQNQVVVITSNSYNDVYGAGLHLRFGAGYRYREDTEFRVTYTFQSLDADFVTPMGDIGISNLYAQYDDYQTNAFDFGVRRYGRVSPRLRAYGEGLIGFALVDKIGVTLVAPGGNLVTQATEFYDSSTALTFAVNVGMLVDATDKIGFFGQLGFRRTGGLAEVDDIIGTGLDDINDKSSRWTLPFIGGIRYQF